MSFYKAIAFRSAWMFIPSCFAQNNQFIYFDIQRHIFRIDPEKEFRMLNDLTIPQVNSLLRYPVVQFDFILCFSLWFSVFDKDIF